MTEINYEKKYKKLEKAVKKFLGGYIWANCDMAEDQGYGIGYMDDDDKPEHVRQEGGRYLRQFNSRTNK